MYSNIIVLSDSLDLETKKNISWKYLIQVQVTSVLLVSTTTLQYKCKPTAFCCLCRYSALYVYQLSPHRFSIVWRKLQEGRNSPMWIGQEYCDKHLWLRERENIRLRQQLSHFGMGYDPILITTSIKKIQTIARDLGWKARDRKHEVSSGVMAPFDNNN